MEEIRTTTEPIPEIPKTPKPKRKPKEPVSAERVNRQLEQLSVAKERDNILPPFTYKGLWFTEKD